MRKKIDTKEIGKISRMVTYPKPNLPTPAVLVACCLIDFLARNLKPKSRCDRFVRFIERRMKKTHYQLTRNDSLKKSQLKRVKCDFKGHEGKKCKTSAEILYRHVRSGLVHNYFGSEGYVIINRPNKKQMSVIVDQSKEYKKYALVLNGSAFIKDFLSSLPK